MQGVVERHRRALDGFGRAVAAASGRWDAPTPCTDWDAEGVVDHVIGFHQVLLLSRWACASRRTTILRSAGR